MDERLRAILALACLRRVMRSGMPPRGPSGGEVLDFEYHVRVNARNLADIAALSERKAKEVLADVRELLGKDTLEWWGLPPVSDSQAVGERVRMGLGVAPLARDGVGIRERIAVAMKN